MKFNKRTEEPQKPQCSGKTRVIDIGAPMLPLVPQGSPKDFQLWKVFCKEIQKPLSRTHEVELSNLDH